MSMTLTLSRESLEALIASDSVDDLTYVDIVFDGEWRWGNSYTLIFKDSADYYWQYSYQEQLGDHYYNSIKDEGDFITVKRAYPHKVTVIEYKDFPDDES